MSWNFHKNIKKLQLSNSKPSYPKKQKNRHNSPSQRSHSFIEPEPENMNGFIADDLYLDDLQADLFEDLPQSFEKLPSPLSKPITTKPKIQKKPINNNKLSASSRAFKSPRNPLSGSTYSDFFNIKKTLNLTNRAYKPLNII